MRASTTFALASLVALSLAACRSDETPAPTPTPAPPVATPSAAPAPAPASIRIAEVQLARAVGADMRAAEPTTTFGPADAIYAVVLTEGAGSGRLGARWTYGEDREAVHDEEHPIDASGTGVHNFRITTPEGFPTGNYQVEILLDGAVVASRDFRVQ